METRYNPAGRRGALAADLGVRRTLRGEPGRPPAHLRRRAPPAQRDGRSAHRPRDGADARRLAHPLEADAGLQLPLPAWLRPCGHLHPGGGRESARARGQDAAGDRSGGVRGARLGLAPPLRPDDHDPVPAGGRVHGLPPRADDHGLRVPARGDAPLRAPVGARLALPRQPDRELVPVPRLVALRPRARPRGGRRRAGLRPLPVRRRRGTPDDRDRSAGDDPRGRGRGRAPRGRALPRHRRTRGARAVRRATGACDRRRARGARLRHRRAQGDARPRSDRLRDRARARAARANGDRPGRADERARRRPGRPDTGGGRRPDPRVVRGARSAGAAGGLPAPGRRLRPLPQPHRAADLAAVVVPHGRAQAARPRRPRDPGG